MRRELPRAVPVEPRREPLLPRADSAELDDPDADDRDDSDDATDRADMGALAPPVRADAVLSIACFAAVFVVFAVPEPLFAVAATRDGPPSGARPQSSHTPSTTCPPHPGRLHVCVAMIFSFTLLSLCFHFAFTLESSIRILS